MRPQRRFERAVLRELSTGLFAASLLSCTHVSVEEMDSDADDVSLASAALGSVVTVATLPMSCQYATIDGSYAFLSGCAPIPTCSDPPPPVLRVSLTGGADTVLVGPVDCRRTSSENTLHGSSVYYKSWSVDGPAQIRVVGKTGAPADTLLTEASGANTHAGIASDGERVYWADDLGIRSKALAGTAPALTLFAAPFTELLAVKDGSVYFTRAIYSASSSRTELRRIASVGGASELIYATGFATYSTAIDATFLYWSATIYEASSRTLLAEIWRRHIATGATERIYSTTGVKIDSLNLFRKLSIVGNTPSSDFRLYWLEQGPGLTVGAIRGRRNPAGSGDVFTARSGMPYPRELYVSPLFAYWVEGPADAALVKRASVP